MIRESIDKPSKKYSTLDGLKDLVIGYKGQIINETNKELNK